MLKAENPDVSRSPGADPVKEEVKEIKPSTDKPGISQHGPAPIANRPVPALVPQRPVPSIKPDVSQLDPSSHAPRLAPAPVIRKVQEGDNLFRLTVSVYGRADDKLVAWVKQNNPWMKDINNIPVGKEIVFPEPKEDQVKDKAKVKDNDKE